MITAVGVVVPARDEEQRIAACLDGVLAALPPGVDAAVVAVLDRCTDATASRVPAGVDVLVNDAPLTVGELRDRGLRRALDRLAGRADPAATWLLSTDADSLVGPGWVHDHLRHAAAGAHTVAGLVDLDPSLDGAPDPGPEYARIVGSGLRPDGHGHVYGANLGMRADAYLAAGGFPAVVHGEDHALVGRLRDAGFRVVTALDGRVRTSARTVGRARGGLADLLASLDDAGDRRLPGGTVAGG